MSVWSDIVGGITKPVIDAISRRAEIKHAEKTQELENKKALSEATIAAIREGRSLDNLWELESLKNSGWKDEFWTILFAAPAFGVFIPWFAPYIEQGFKVLDSSTPEWYRWLLVIIVGAAFGVRVWRRL